MLDGDCVTQAQCEHRDAEEEREDGVEVVCCTLASLRERERKAPTQRNKAEFEALTMPSHTLFGTGFAHPP